MRAIVLASLLLLACDNQTETVTSAEQTSGIFSTWRAPNATLALTPHPYAGRPGSYVYVAPNGAAVLGGFTTSGDKLLLDGFPEGRFTLAGDMLSVVLPDTNTVYVRANTYCIPTAAQQSCQ